MWILRVLILGSNFAPKINFSVTDELMETGAFEHMDVRNEESEHSIEMQLPFLAKIFEKYGVTNFVA